VNESARQRRGRDVLLSVIRDRRRIAALTPVEWDALIPAAEEAKVLPRLATDAESLLSTVTLPDWAGDRLASARMRGRDFERAVKWEVTRVQRALRPLGVQPVFLKGAGYIVAGLACGVARVVADVDVLVPEADLPSVQAALMQHGWAFEPLDPYDERYYREWMHELPPMRHQERGTMLDVHHRILPRTGRVHPPTERLLASSVDVGDARVLSTEHMLLHSAAHVFQDGEVAGALRDLVDLRDLLDACARGPTLDVRLVGEAEALNLGRSLFYAVRYARLVGCEIDVPGANTCRPSRSVLALMDRLVERTLMAPVGPLGSMSAFALYARSHWLKMPPGRLVRHLTRKAIGRVSKANQRR
jgi:hypothetical protein